MSIEHGKRVRSIRDMKIKGTVVGYGSIMWLSGVKDGNTIDDKAVHAVYLVRPDNMIGSMNGGPTVLVMRADMTVID